MRAIRSGVLVFSLLTSAAANADAVSDLLAQYQAAGAEPFSAAGGAKLWGQEHPAEDGQMRACTSCHTADLREAGKHAVTGKAIEPLAPSVNPQRLTNASQIQKWLGRNCKWTLGRDCTPQEKGDLLSFIRNQ